MRLLLFLYTISICLPVLILPYITSLTPNSQFLAETTEYEVTIEDMARTNQELHACSEHLKVLPPPLLSESQTSFKRRHCSQLNVLFCFSKHLERK